MTHRQIVSFKEYGQGYAPKHTCKVQQSSLRRVERSVNLWFVFMVNNYYQSVSWYIASGCVWHHNGALLYFLVHKPR